MNTRRVNKALNEAVRLLDKQIADTQKTMQELNKQDRKSTRLNSSHVF